MKRFILLVFWCLVIFVLSSIPSAKIHEKSSLDFILRKTAHIVEYFILFVLAYRAFSLKDKEKFDLKTAFYAFIFSSIYAASDEYHQSFVPGRGPSIIDVGIDIIGITLGYIFLWKYRLKIPANLKKLVG